MILYLKAKFLKCTSKISCVVIKASKSSCLLRSNYRKVYSKLSPWIVWSCTNFNILRRLSFTNIIKSHINLMSVLIMVKLMAYPIPARGLSIHLRACGAWGGDGMRWPNTPWLLWVRTVPSKVSTLWKFALPPLFVVVVRLRGNISASVFDDSFAELWQHFHM